MICIDLTASRLRKKKQLYVEMSLYQTKVDHLLVLEKTIQVAIRISKKVRSATCTTSHRNLNLYSCSRVQLGASVCSVFGLSNPTRMVVPNTIDSQRTMPWPRCAAHYFLPQIHLQFLVCWWVSMLIMTCDTSLSAGEVSKHAEVPSLCFTLLRSPIGTYNWKGHFLNVWEL